MLSSNADFTVSISSLKQELVLSNICSWIFRANIANCVIPSRFLFRWTFKYISIVFSSFKSGASLSFYYVVRNTGFIMFLQIIEALFVRCFMQLLLCYPMNSGVLFPVFGVTVSMKMNRLLRPRNFDLLLPASFQQMVQTQRHWIDPFRSRHSTRDLFQTYPVCRSYTEIWTFLWLCQWK